MHPTKQQLRKELKTRRAAMSPDDVARASEAIRLHLLQIDALRNAATVFIYVSTRNEPNTRPLIRDLLTQNKTVYVPRLDPDGLMHAHKLSRLEDLIENDPAQFNIPVPPPDAPIEKLPGPGPGVALIPGLAFTPSGQRLGMGGGHYDRYLTDHPNTTCVGLCYTWQILDNLPHEPHDQPMHHLATEHGVIDCGALPG